MGFVKNGSEMFKKLISYTDLDGNAVEEEYYFGLDKPELIKYGLAQDSELEAYFRKIVKEENVKELIILLDDFIMRSVGKRSEDGKRFVKTPEITDSFKQTGAYSEFFMWVVSNPKEVENFFLEILPPDMKNELSKKLEDGTLGEKNYTEADLLKMTDEEFDALVGTDTKKMTKTQLQILFKRKLANA